MYKGITIFSYNFISKFILFLITFLYTIYSIPKNLIDDHGIVITAALQFSNGYIPGIDFGYPHGILSPILLGLIIKIFSFFGVGWQYAYFLSSTTLFILIIFALKHLFKKLYDLNNHISLLFATFTTASMLFPWGGFYFDYLSIFVIFISCIFLYKCLIKLENSDGGRNNLDTSSDFLILGFISFINPFLIKLTTAYSSLILLIIFVIYITKINFSFQVKLRIFRDYIFGLMILPLLFLLTHFFNIDNLIQTFKYSYAPLLYADNLGNYSLFNLPKSFFDFIYLTCIGSFLIGIFIPFLFSNKKTKLFNCKLICKIYLFSFLYQFGVAWGRDKNWVFLLVSFALLSLIFNITNLKKNRKELVNKFFIIFLIILNLFYFVLYTTYSMFISLKARKANLNLTNTKASLFRLKEGTDWAISKDILNISEEINLLLNSDKINSYSYLDDNAFLLPLLIGKAPSQPYAFYQLNKTIFLSNPININNYNLGNSDIIVFCNLPASNFSINKSIDVKFNILNKNNIFKINDKSNIKLQERFIRVLNDNSDFLKAKNIYVDLSKIYKDNYFYYYKNDSCLIYTKENLS